MIKHSILFFTGLFTILFAEQLIAQNSSRQELIDRSASEYMQSAGSDAALYYGYQQAPLPRTTNLPYLNGLDYTTGRLSYHQVVYPNVLLKLDLYRNELVVKSSYGDIVLFPENVDFAELLGKRIIYFRSDSLPGCPSTGYYFLLNSGKCKVLEKQTASLSSYSSQEGPYYDFKKNFYLMKDGIYYKITSQKSLLTVLQAYRKELKQYISSLQLDYKKFPDIVIAMTVDEYEKLSGV